jgi:hypothetical protein
MSIQSETEQFKLVGSASNNLDVFGNLHLSKVYSMLNETGVFFPVSKYTFSDDEIEKIYDVEITELSFPKKPGTVSIIPNNSNTNNNTAEELTMLRTRLEETLTSDVELLAAKDTIVQLRIQLGEGSVADDFSSEFPYLPK